MSLTRPARSLMAVAAMVFVGGWLAFAQAQPPAPGQGVATQGGVPAGRGRGAPPAEPGQTVTVTGRDGGPSVVTLDPGMLKGPVVPLSPAEQAKRFWLPQGYRMEAVVSEPHVQEPGQIAFDGNGRMFVAELRGYMQDMEATGQLDPIGVITVHEDKNNDGVYETHGTFVDGLVFPRWVTPFGANAVLTNESTGDEVWKFTDTNNDGKADRKELFATGFGRLTNIELQQSGLTWALDNWMYSTVNQFRVRWTPKGILREPTSRNGGQWGLTQDSYGKIWFQDGGSGMPMDFQSFPVYGTFDYPDQYEEGLRVVWGAPVLAADFGLDNMRRPDGSLIRTTAGAGNDIFRGDRLPQDLVGDYLYGETVGRVVRRHDVVNVEGMTQLRNFAPQAEFIRSTDPLFRPVDMTTAPDGTLYITDMYRGVIQEKQWAQAGSYKRARIEQLSMEKVIRHGRIWRVSYDGMPRDTRPPRMLDESPAALVAHLSHPNGWWRDTAQQLLVLKQDKSVVPALRRIAASSTNQLGRIHALWTLEGLEAMDAPLVRAMMKDTDPKIRLQAVRASETLYKGGDRSFAADYRALARDRDTDVVIQALLTSNILRVADTPALIRTTMAGNPAKGVQIIGAALLAPAAAGGTNIGGDAMLLTSDEQAVMARGQTIYTETCFACHGGDGRGAPGGAPGTTRAPSLAGSPRVIGHRDYIIHGLLHGISGPIDGRRYDDVMVPMGANPDEWVAAVSSYVRNAFGNRASFVTGSDVARVRSAAPGRTTSWTVAEMEARVPTPMVISPEWRLTASHNPATARNALGLAPWTTGVPQQPGMWLQVELPQASMVTEIQFNAESGFAGGGGGGRGRAGAPGAVQGARGAGAAAIAPAVVSAPIAGTTPMSPASPQALAAGGYPRGYRVEVSMDGATWGAPVAEGRGAPRSTVISFAPVRARFVRITQTATTPAAPPWVVTELRIFAAGAGR
jgi:mono/diheme cytochrome c family protein/glucose/arabinose dehydrogenase